MLEFVVAGFTSRASAGNQGRPFPAHWAPFFALSSVPPRQPTIFPADLESVRAIRQQFSPTKLKVLP